MNSNNCGTLSPCDTSIAERPRYFPRQLITPDDLTLEQEYFRNKLRRHNRMLHGWGVVCGAKVCPAPVTTGAAGDPSGASTQSSFQPWLVAVSSGYILGPYGDEIIVDCCRTVDVRTAGTTGITGEPCVQAPDPWCTDVYVKRDPNAPLYIAVKYKECSARPVRVQPIGCGCDDTQCEYSRLRDGYEIGILNQCPDTHQDPPQIDGLAKGATPGCPACPSSPWVVLAKVTVDDDGTIASIDNCTCRRIVLSFGSFWWACQSAQLSIKGVAAANTATNLQAVPQGTKSLAMNVALDTQQPLPVAPQSKADLGAGVVVNSFVPGAPGQPAALNVDVLAAASTGPRTLTITTADGSEASLEKAIIIVAATAGGSTPAPSPAPSPSPAPAPQPSGGTPAGTQPTAGGVPTFQPASQPAPTPATPAVDTVGGAVSEQPTLERPARRRGKNP